jgi:inner membrane protein YidH
MNSPAFDDPRIPLAAERTLLAWVRTGLALMGFGFVVARFGLFLRELAAVRPGPASVEGPSVWIGAGMVALGAAINVLAAVRHVRLLRALGAGGPYRPAVWSLGIITTLALAALGAALTAYLLLHSAP